MPPEGELRETIGVKFFAEGIFPETERAGYLFLFFLERACRVAGTSIVNPWQWGAQELVYLDMEFIIAKTGRQRRRKRARRVPAHRLCGLSMMGQPLSSPPPAEGATIVAAFLAMRNWVYPCSSGQYREEIKARATARRGRKASGGDPKKSSTRSPVGEKASLSFLINRCP